MGAAGGGRILFVSVHPPGRVPSQRFRFEQYVDFLAAHGLETTFSPILRDDEYSVMYRAGGVPRKALIAARGALRRLREAVEASSAYDIVVIQREAIQLGTAVFEAAMSRSSARLVFDFDDAIWLPEASDANRRLSWLKRPGKVQKIIACSDMVFAGNAYLAEYARAFNPNVRIVPTTIDTSEYVPKGTSKDDSRICIGWSGSVTTLKHFDLAIPVLRRVRELVGERVYFKVIGDGAYRNEELDIRGLDWRPETEVEDLSEFDIGLMPLPDDRWAKGKCGLKGLQYMALEIPTVMSPVGVNREIIEDGVNGFLASSVDDWSEKLVGLVESAELRRCMGTAARQTVVDRYSMESQKGNYLAALRGLLGAPALR